MHATMARALRLEYGDVPERVVEIAAPSDAARCAGVLRLLPALGASLALACGNGSGGGGAGGQAPPPPASVTFAPAFGSLGFAAAVDLVQHPTSPDRWYAVEQRGKIFTFLASNPSGSLSLALDLETLIDLSMGGEQGLLNLVFDPDFAGNGEVFLSYTQQAPQEGHVVARFASADNGLTFAPSGADPTVLRFPPQQANHNGGDLAFGPDGYLYYTMGDGGGAGDPDPEDGQNLQTLFGKVMRLDVSVVPYAIPPDNPFVGSAALDEIWAYGLRNPWRMSFDRQTGELWLGDVGQSMREEIDRIVKGGNYGWDCREGDVDFDPDPNCMPPLIEPEVVHGRGEAQSITGGYVYRGSALPALAGAYVYGDFITGRVWAYYFAANPRHVDEIVAPAGLSISSFSEDQDGELYLIDYGAMPSIYKLVP